MASPSYSSNRQPPWKKRFLFTSNTQSKKGIMSSVCSLLSLLAFIIIMVSVLKTGGMIDRRLGALSFVSFLFGLFGLLLAIMSLFEKDRFPFFPRFGFILSFISCLLWSAIVYMGLYD